MIVPVIAVKDSPRLYEIILTVLFTLTVKHCQLYCSIKQNIYNSK